MRRIAPVLVIVALALQSPAARAEVATRSYALPAGGGYPHDVAVGADGIVG